MALRDSGALVTLALPSAYSFWASIIIRVLSEGDAVEGETPVSSRKEEAPIVAVGGVDG